MGNFMYETFQPDEASRLVERFLIQFKSKHARRLNIGEIDLSAMVTQLLVVEAFSMLVAYECRTRRLVYYKPHKGAGWRSKAKEPV